MSITQSLAIPAKKFLSSIAIVTTAVGLSACQEETILTPEQFGNTENGAFTTDGTYYFASDLTNPNKPSTIVELQWDGNAYSGKIVAEGHFDGKDCDFNGLTAYEDILYAACGFVPEDTGGLLPTGGSSALVRIDTNKTSSDADYIQHVPLLGESALPNGMAADKNGDLYITNSQSWLTTYTLGGVTPAIVKVSVDDTNGFSISQEPWYYPGLMDKFPNGIRVTDEHVYFVNGRELKRFNIREDGSAGTDLVLYSSPACGLMDDFDIADNGYIVTSELTSNDALLMSILWPGYPCALGQNEGFLVGINGNGLGGKLGKYAYENGTVPSSVLITTDAASTKYPSLQLQSIISTAYFSGGIQTVYTD
ncbi:MAG: hypothetical protein K6L73_10425 [Cellvibrionaceae bacterium]